MFNINDTNGDSLILEKYQLKLLEEFPDTRLVGAEFGVAYGGGIEQVCKIWKGQGIIFGYDTFDTHPRYLVKDQKSLEAGAMEGWYQQYGTDKLGIEYINKELYKLGTYNYHLVKGEINKESKIDDLAFHYVLLDFDILESMQAAFDLVKDSIIKGCYLCVHDIIPENHMPRLHNWWFNEILPVYKYKRIQEGQHLVVYRV